MTLLELTIAILFLIMLMLCFVRVLLALPHRSYKQNQNRIDSFEIGTMKTIGDREVQEDEYGINNFGEGLMAVLADGQGKLHSGRIASLSSIQVFQEVFQLREAFYHPQYYFGKAFRRANKEILQKLADNRGTASVGVALIKNLTLYYAVVGNIKIAVYRNRELVPISTGHTIDMLAKQKYQEGTLTKQETVTLLENHRLYNFVGRDGFYDVEVFDTAITLRTGEYVLLMSDGVYDTVRWRDIEECLAKEASCQSKAEAIVEMIDQNPQNDKDNASIMIIRVY
ncbi:PP2C family protein-serine/threonine phosphatase [Lacrimispora brassicae]